LPARGNYAASRQIVIFSTSTATTRSRSGPARPGPRALAQSMTADIIICQPDHGIRARAKFRERDIEVWLERQRVDGIA
jgi:hypothetical protein